MYRYLRRVRTECPDNAFDLDEKHQMNVFDVCVVSPREAPTLWFTSAINKQWTYCLLFAWVPYGRHRYCVLHRRETHRERIYRYLRGVRTEYPGNAFHLGDKHHVNVFTVICAVSARKAPALCFTSARGTQRAHGSLFRNRNRQAPRPRVGPWCEGRIGPRHAEGLRVGRWLHLYSHVYRPLLTRCVSASVLAAEFCAG